MSFLGTDCDSLFQNRDNIPSYLKLRRLMDKREKKAAWKWLVVAVALIFFAFMAILPFAWEDGDDVPAPNPTIDNG